MMDIEKIKAIAFDFGGTLDSPFQHWMEVYLYYYVTEFYLPLTKESFRESYVYAEQMMERLPLVQPSHSLLETQQVKLQLQFEKMIARYLLPDVYEYFEKVPNEAARLITDYATVNVNVSKPVLAALAKRYPLLLVSNYYGNLKKVVTDLGIAPYFVSITDSTIERIRKPDPALWKIAFDRQGYAPEEVLVVGDSMKNDIFPALSLGCQVVHGCPDLSQEEVLPSVNRISSLDELPALLL
ncbi:MAG: HAD family hydrolase [Bacteroides sp.]